MGNKVPYYCLRCFHDSESCSHLSQTEIIVYSPPFEIPSSPTPRPAINSSTELVTLEEKDVTPGDDLEDNYPDYHLRDIHKNLNEAWTGLLEIVKMDCFPLLVNKEDVKVYGREGSRGYFLKTCWTIPQSAAEFFTFMHKISLRPSWDSNLEEGRLVATLPSDISVNYQKFKKVMTVSTRELLVACKTVQYGNPTIEVSTSVDSPAFPLSPDAIRARLFVGGYYLERGDKDTKVTAVSEMDFGGAIPKGFMMKMSAMAMPSFVRSLKAALEKDCEQKL